MLVNGTYIGLGLGDSSAEIQKIKAYMRTKFASYAGALADTPLFDQAMAATVTEMESRYVAAGKLDPKKYIPGVINLEVKYVMGYLQRPAPRLPLFFTVEGHMSTPWVGPCAATASQMESEGRCHWQPIGYDTTSLPFNNQSGKDELRRLLSLTTMDNGVPFPAGTPWVASSFSQGSIVWCEFFMDEVRNPQGDLHWRYPDFKGALVHGNPDRQADIVAEWIPDPPKPGTHGISDRLMTDTPTAIWKEVCRHGDLYTENTSDEVGLDKTAIYKIVAENSWVGGPAAILTRVLALMVNPAPEVIVMAQAIISGILFLGNMDPHGGYDLNPGMSFMRGRLAA